MKARVVLMLVAALAVAAPLVLAQSSPQEELFARLMRRYKASSSQFARFRFSTSRSLLGDPAVNLWDAQLAAADSSFLGRPNDALLYFPIASPPPPALPDPARYHAADAGDWIMAHVAGQQLVMFNEAHHVSQTRLLTLSLLKPLYAAGFRYLALETLRNDGVPPLPSGYPQESSGEYTRDPVMADLVREAVRLGYTLVPYEAAPSEMAPIAAREKAQARNLARFLAAHPGARMVIHAGYSHTAKTSSVTIAGSPVMATHLLQATHARALSIDQTSLTPKSLASTEAMDAQALLAKEFAAHGPVVFVSSARGAAWSAAPGAYDASVLLPPSPKAVIRPSWLELGGKRRSVPINAVHCQQLYPCLVQAYVAGEPDRAIPADQVVLLVASEGATPLFLRDGEYRVRYITNEDQVTYERRISVPGGTGEVAPIRLP